MIKKQTGNKTSYSGTTEALRNRVGVVAIGRNEGERLSECLQSAAGEEFCLIYVDSGSADNSLALARAQDARVVQLDITSGFSAAKARNAGAREIEQCKISSEFFQFVDGDCVLDPNWIESGTAFLQSNPEYAVVCGRRRERYPDASIYNSLCDREWDTPVGDAGSCGGDALYRASAFRDAQGFNETVIAGEEPELCVRLRQAGWKIRRLDAEMTLHDANMHRFSQWWARARRAGFAYAQGVALHGRGPQYHWVREALRAWIWALVIPATTAIACLLFGPVGLLPLLVYPLLWTRTFLAERRRSESWYRSALWATACVICKFPELLGQLQFIVSGGSNKAYRPIEYKMEGK